MSTPISAPARDRVIEALQRRGCKSRDKGKTWTCPAHEDGNPSLSLGSGRKGVVLRCHAGCTTEKVVEAIGLTMADLFAQRLPRRNARAKEPEATYDYRDRAGRLLFQVVRLPGKQFRQRRPDPASPGGWLWNLMGVERVLYELPELAAAVAAGKTVYIAEGEKDVEALRRFGVAATCNPGGAGKWGAVRGQAREVLSGAHVVIVRDKDGPAKNHAGERHAAEIARSLIGIAASVKVVEAKTGKDAADHLEAGHGVEDLVPVDDMSAVPESPDLTPIDTNRPTIQISADLGQNVEDAEACLARDPNVYQRGHALVRVVKGAPAPRGLSRPRNSAAIVPLNGAHTRELLAKNAAWIRVDERSRLLAPCLPSEPVVGALLSRHEWPNVRPLEGITQCPVLRSDGSVLSEDGYDAATGLIYESRGLSVEIPDAPSLSDAKAAVTVLEDLVGDFPFEAPAHRSAWIAGLLTPLARCTFEGASPLNVYDGNTPGVGKGLLAAVTGTIVSGQPMPVLSLPRTDDEMEKRITAIGLAGDSLVLLDNIRTVVNHPSLDAALTAPHGWRGRVLGRSQMSATLNLNVTWFANGNNIAFATDTLDRVLHVRLVSPLERPRARAESDFKRPRLLEYVRENRALLLHAALTILRAFHACGRPRQPLMNWGSFEEWSAAVRAPLVWAGLDDPAGTRLQLLDGGDSESDAMRALLVAWQVSGGDRGLTVAEALAIATSREKNTPGSDALRRAIAGFCPGRDSPLPDARELGNRLKACKDRVVGGLRMNAGRKVATGVLWVARAVNAAPNP